MAVIPQGVTNLVESVVSYLYIILLILIIVKIIQLVGSIGGGFGGGSKGDSTKNTKSNRDNGDKTTGEGNGGKSGKTSKDPKKKKSHYTYLDPSRLGNVHFKVEDVEGNPVRGAEVIITPNRQKRRFAESLANESPAGTVKAPPDGDKK